MTYFVSMSVICDLYAFYDQEDTGFVNTSVPTFLVVVTTSNMAESTCYWISSKFKTSDCVDPTPKSNDGDWRICGRPWSSFRTIYLSLSCQHFVHIFHMSNATMVVKRNVKISYTYLIGLIGFSKNIRFLSPTPWSPVLSPNHLIISSIELEIVADTNSNTNCMFVLISIKVLFISPYIWTM